jgi:hypothetical protein
MNQRDAAIDLVLRRLAARRLQVRLADVPEIGSAMIVIVMVVRLREERERSGENDREKGAHGEPPGFEGRDSNAPREPWPAWPDSAFVLP